MAKQDLENINKQITRMQESIDILSNAVTELNQKGLHVNLTSEQLGSISQAAIRGVTYGAKNIKLQAPDLSQQEDKIAERITSTVCRSVLESVSRKVDETIKSRRLDVKLEHQHQHHHYNMYGRFASSERNRKTMMWLGFLNVAFIAEGILILLTLYGKINWYDRYIETSLIVTIVVAIIGYIIRISANEKNY